MRRVYLSLIPLLSFSCIDATSVDSPLDSHSAADVLLPPTIDAAMGSGGSINVSPSDVGHMDPCRSNPCPRGTRCTADGGEADCIPQDCQTLSCGPDERCIEVGEGAECEENVCDSDLDCPADQHCGDGCQPDVCAEGTSRCEENAIIECDPNGGGETLRFSCPRPDLGFQSECTVGADNRAACRCEDNWDCPEHLRCINRLCVGRPEAPSCRLDPQAFTEALPSPEIIWGGSHDDPIAPDRPFSPSTQVVLTPLVANMSDDNGDGLINTADIPDLVFLSFCGNSFTRDGALRIVHGGGDMRGMDAIAVLGEHRWVQGDALPDAGEFDCSDGILDSTAPLAIGDLDDPTVTDGRPEIIGSHEISDGGLVIFDHEGRQLTNDFPGELSEGPNPAPSISNLDAKGPAELIVGRTVFTIERTDEGFQFVDRFVGSSAQGRNPQGAISCVADILGTGRPQVIAGSSVYVMPRAPAGVERRSDCIDQGGAIEPQTDEERAFCAGELLLAWDGRQVNGAGANREGYCAIADVLGADQAAPPGPLNPLDGQPELVLVSSGRIQIFNGQTGEMLRNENPRLGSGGGAPNVDDFDGDGFPEIGSAFAIGYVMLDLQETSDACPAWDVLLQDDESIQPPSRSPGGPECEEDAQCIPGASVCNVDKGQCVCLHNGWKSATEDDSSRVTGSTLFDFNGDGAAEVIYNDECFFRIYDGSNGDILFKEPSESRTRIEYPVVADVDNDGNAEIVFSTSTESTFCSQRNEAGGPNGERWRTLYNSGIEVWGDPNDAWVSARRIWNQHSYHVTQILEDGRVPLAEKNSWQSHQGRQYNTYRSQPRTRGVAPDLVISEMAVSAPGDGCGTLDNSAQISAIVLNQGDLRVGSDISVAFEGEWADGTRRPLRNADGSALLASLGTTLEPGRQIRLSTQYDAATDPDAGGRLPERLLAKVDALGDPNFGSERECDESNNDASVDVASPEGLPDLRVISMTAETLVCPRGAVQTTIGNFGDISASEFEVALFVGDPQTGRRAHREFIAGPLEPGGQYEFDVLIDEVVVDGSLRLIAVVDPDEQIRECSDDDNERVGPAMTCILP